MRLADFDFVLPPELIAQAPATEREGARLYALPLDGAPASHHAVSALPHLLPERALLVVNDTRVIPARLLGKKPSGGRVELLLVERVSDEPATADGAWSETWLALGGASKPIRPGLSVLLDGARPPSATVIEVRGAEVTVRFEGSEAGGLLAALPRIGEVPLPPYIQRSAGPVDDDRDRYQTVYARVPGSAAAPTAGLHLGQGLLSSLAAAGIERAAITLHVGLGTFSPLRIDDDASLEGPLALHRERYVIPEATVAAVARARAEGRKVIAVGTTSVRALESAFSDERGGLMPGPGETTIFIRPGHRFRAVDGMLTNFHLPRSSLLMLVSALCGRERLLSAYADAVARGYRFFSYGDAMLLT